jgi:hypothetical protein
MQENFREWAMTRYPEAWANLKKRGCRVTESMLCHINVDRIPDV